MPHKYHLDGAFDGQVRFGNTMCQARPAAKPAIPAGSAFLRVLHSSSCPNHSLDQPLCEILLLDIAQPQLRTEYGGTDKGLAAGHYSNGPTRIKVAVMKPLTSFFYSIAHSLQFPESHQASQGRELSKAYRFQVAGYSPRCRLRYRLCNRQSHRG